VPFGLASSLVSAIYVCKALGSEDVGIVVDTECRLQTPSSEQGVSANALAVKVSTSGGLDIRRESR